MMYMRPSPDNFSMLGASVGASAALAAYSIIEAVEWDRARASALRAWEAADAAWAEAAAAIDHAAAVASEARAAVRANDRLLADLLR